MRNTIFLFRIKCYNVQNGAIALTTWNGCVVSSDTMKLLYFILQWFDGAEGDRDIPVIFLFFWGVKGCQ